MHARSLTPATRRLAVLLGLALTPAALSAADGQWTTPDSGAWLQPSNWKQSVIAGGPDAVATFDSAPQRDSLVTLDAPRTIGALHLLGTRQWHIGGEPLTLATTGANPPVILSRGGDYHLVAVPLLGTRGLHKIGPGGIILRGANAYSGLTILESGKIYLHGRQALGVTGPGNGTIIHANTSGSQLHFALPDSPIPVSEDILLRRTSPGASTSIYNDKGDTSLAGGLVLERGGRDGAAVHSFGIQVNANTLTISGPVSGALSASASPASSPEGSILRFRTNSDTSVVHLSGSVSDGSIGPGGLALATDPASKGVVRITAGNIHGGSTLHAGGTLLVSNTEGSGTGSGSVLVQAVLGGTGVIVPGGANGVLVTSTGVVSPGDSESLGNALTVSLRETSGNIAFDAGARLAIDLAPLSPQVAERLVVTGLSAARVRVLFNNNPVDFTIAAGRLPDGVYPIIQFDAPDAYSGQLVIGKGLEGRQAALVHTANAISLRLGAGAQ